MRDLTTILKKSEPSVAEIRIGLGVVNEGIETSEEAIEAASIKRQALLIDGSDADLAAVDENLASERLQLDRLKAKRDALQIKLPEAQARAAEAKRAAAYAEAHQLLAGALQDIEDYRSAAKDGSDALGRLKSKKAKINGLCEAHKIAIDSPETAHRNKYYKDRLDVRMPRLLEDVVLPVPSHPTASFWPRNLPEGDIY